MVLYFLVIDQRWLSEIAENKYKQPSADMTKQKEFCMDKTC
jgi:hypothetical protein